MSFRNLFLERENSCLGARKKVDGKEEMTRDTEQRGHLKLAAFSFSFLDIFITFYMWELD